MANRRHIWNGAGMIAPFGIQEGDHYKDNTSGKMYLYSGETFIEVTSPNEIRDRSTHTGTQPLSSISQSSAVSGQVPTWDGTMWVPTTPVGAGDMLVSVYDTTSNGIVDNSEMLDGQLPEYYLDRTNHFGSQPVSSIIGLAPIATSGSGNDLANSSISLSKISNITQGTLLGRYNVGTGIIEQLSPSQITEMLSLDSVDNTSDLDKPISNATIIALSSKENTITATTSADYYRGDKVFAPLTKSVLGLNNVDNTSDLDKPISIATSGALDNKENTIIGTTSGYYYRGDKAFAVLNKTAVGLDNVDNTSDENKPISNAVQSALDFKADLVGGVIPTSQLPPIAITDYLGMTADTTSLLTLSGQKGDWAVVSATTQLGIITVNSGGSNINDWVLLQLGGSASVNSVNGYTGVVVLGKSDVGLSNVDNTSDLNKPISNATSTALNNKENTITATTSADYYRGDKVFAVLNKTAVGLSNVDNTSDLNKPISNAVQSALDLKINKLAEFNTTATGNYTLLQSDNAKTLILDNTVTSIIVPAGLTVGTQIQIFNSKGSAVTLTTTAVTAKGKGTSTMISNDAYACITYQTGSVVLISGKLE